MKQTVILNGTKRTLSAEPQTPLSDVLRSEGLLSVKKTGQRGLGCSCTILLDGKPVPSDIIPFAIIKNANIQTLEYFSSTEDFQNITKGFEQAGIKLCGYCNSGMIFTAYDIMQNSQRPTLQEIEKSTIGLSFCCTNRKAFIAGIRCAISYRAKRSGNGRNVRK